ncbi:MAG: magnesium/cobalt transporter CorA [bacterium]
MQRLVPGAAPGQIIIDPEAAKPKLSAICYGPEKFEELTLEDPGEIPALLKRFEICWIHVIGLGDADVIKRLGEVFRLHALALEDVVNQAPRAKLEEFEEQVLLLAQSVYPESGADTRPVAIFWGKGFVVTFQAESNGCWNSVRERIRSGRTRIRSWGADYLAYALIDSTVDHFFPTVEQRLDRLTDLEQDVSQTSVADLAARLTELKHELVMLRGALVPLREALVALHRSESELITEGTRPYIRDALDHVLQLLDLIESARDRANNLLNLNLSLVGYRTNEVMRVLTIIATIFIPLTFVAGLYGMNFNGDKSPLNMPELRWYYGYPALLLAMAVIVAGLVYFFFRKGWLGKGR